MLLLRGATRAAQAGDPVITFQYMLLLRGATCPFATLYLMRRCFNTCSSCEEQHSRPERRLDCLVSIHAPLARSNFMRGKRRRRVNVSIHAPLARSNLAIGKQLLEWMFQYMLLLRGATQPHAAVITTSFVSIHAPLARSNQHQLDLFDFAQVSIHAPLARSNNVSTLVADTDGSFNTCSSCEEQLMVLLGGVFFNCFNTCSSCEEQPLQR